MLICYLLFKYLQYFHFTRKGKYRELSIHVYAYSKFFSSEMENIVKKTRMLSEQNLHRTCTWTYIMNGS